MQKPQYIILQNLFEYFTLIYAECTMFIEELIKLQYNFRTLFLVYFLPNLYKTPCIQKLHQFRLAGGLHSHTAPLDIWQVGGICLLFTDVLYVYKEFCEGLEENRAEIIQELH